MINSNKKRLRRTMMYHALKEIDYRGCERVVRRWLRMQRKNSVCPLAGR